MTINDLRNLTNMTQKEFGKYLNIPIRTIQNWESEHRTPPEYVVELIEYKIKKEKLSMRKLVELNEGTRTELFEGNLEEAISYIKNNPNIYDWINDRELDTQQLMNGNYTAKLIELDLGNVETWDDLECELDRISLGWWDLVVE